jgi:hypothetical protein
MERENSSSAKRIKLSATPVPTVTILHASASRNRPIFSASRNRTVTEKLELVARSVRTLQYKPTAQLIQANRYWLSDYKRGQNSYTFTNNWSAGISLSKTSTKVPCEFLQTMNAGYLKGALHPVHKSLVIRSIAPWNLFQAA